MPFKLAPRLKSFDYRGCHRYFLTICTHERRPVFLQEDAVERALAPLRGVADEQRLAIIAYCFMPDHLHALAEGAAETADFPKFVRLFKQKAAFEWKQARGERLWQRGYYDRVLRNDEATATVARYLLENPVRAGLVDSPEEYPFLGSFTMNLEDLLASIQIDNPSSRRRA